MSYTALYRKFRPDNFADVKGQDHIVTTLTNQIKHNRIGHAYLFCGTRGTGKTTVAKILAKAVNCEHPVNGSPCNECAMCKAIQAGTAMNVIEIDAASNNGVDNIREIREEVSYRPTEGKYKVYIIDEVHMLSTGAFNALLKTLEEIRVNDRGAIVNFMLGLNAYTISSGIFPKYLNGENIISVPLAENETMHIGYVLNENQELSELGKSHLEELRKYAPANP